MFLPDELVILQAGAPLFFTKEKTRRGEGEALLDETSQD